VFVGAVGSVGSIIGLNTGSVGSIIGLNTGSVGLNTGSVGSVGSVAFYKTSYFFDFTFLSPEYLLPKKIVRISSFRKILRISSFRIFSSFKVQNLISQTIHLKI